MNLITLKNVLKYFNIRTLYFNFKYFPFNKAVILPIFINRNVIVKELSGKIILPSLIYPGIIRIGYGNVGIFDKKHSKTILEIAGQIIFNGRTFIGHGSRICIGKDGILSLGNNFNITAESSIICFKSINIGNDCLLSWGILMMDTDFHKIKKYNNWLNEDMAIEIKNNVWIGTRATVLKGSIIPDGSVLAAGSIVNKPFLKSNCILAGIPAKIVNEDIEWEM